LSAPWASVHELSFDLEVDAIGTRVRRFTVSLVEVDGISLIRIRLVAVGILHTKNLYNSITEQMIFSSLLTPSSSDEETS
jgi:hypothetical protein